MSFPEQEIQQEITKREERTDRRRVIGKVIRFLIWAIIALFNTKTTLGVASILAATSAMPSITVIIISVLWLGTGFFLANESRA